MMRYLIPAVMGYWVGVLVILLRRRNRLLTTDLQFFSAGTFVVLGFDCVLWFVIALIQR